MAEEARLQKTVLDWLAAHGWYAIKIIAGNRAGVPDILACRNGKFVAIEVKSDIGQVSALQWRSLQQVREAGGQAMVVRPGTWPASQRLLQLYERRA